MGFCYIPAWFYHGIVGWHIFSKDLVVRKFSANSPDFVKYYAWVFPLGFGLTMYSILEAYAWQLKKSVLTSFLKGNVIQTDLLQYLAFFSSSM